MRSAPTRRTTQGHGDRRRLLIQRATLRPWPRSRARSGCAHRAAKNGRPQTLEIFAFDRRVFQISTLKSVHDCFPLVVRRGLRTRVSNHDDARAEHHAPSPELLSRFEVRALCKLRRLGTASLCGGGIVGGPDELPTRPRSAFEDPKERSSIPRPKMNREVGWILFLPERASLQARASSNVTAGGRRRAYAACRRGGDRPRVGVGILVYS